MNLLGLKKRRLTVLFRKFLTLSACVRTLLNMFLYQGCDPLLARYRLHECSLIGNWPNYLHCALISSFAKITWLAFVTTYGSYLVVSCWPFTGSCTTVKNSTFENILILKIDCCCISDAIEFTSLSGNTTSFWYITLSWPFGILTYKLIIWELRMG